MQTSVLERIKELLSYYELSEYAYSKKIGINQTTINNYLNEKRGFSLSAIIATLQEFPEVSPSWLLLGQGSMLNADNLPTISGTENLSEMELHALLARKTAECEELQKENTKLLAQLEFMEGYNMRLQKKYLTLENKLSDREKTKAV